MKTLILIFAYMFVLVGGIFIYIGLDLKKWYSWIIVLYGFTVGFLVGKVWVDINTGVTAGMLLAILVLVNGTMVQWHRRKWGGALEKTDIGKYPFLTKWANMLKKLFRI